MSEKSVCPGCGTTVALRSKFCECCGAKIEESTKAKGFFGGIKVMTKGIGDKASGIADRVGGKEAISGLVSEEKATNAVRRMLKLVTQVARDVKKELPADMVKAVDLTAEASFIAFTIGVSIDLEQIELRRGNASQGRLIPGSWFEMYKDSADKFRFRLKAANGETITVSEAYESKSACKNGVESVKKNATIAIIKDLTV